LSYPKAEVVGNWKTDRTGGQVYGVSKDLDLSFCLGTPIEQVAVGKYDVQFRFGSGARICVQGNVEILRSGRLVASWDEKSGWTSIGFQEILNVSVESISIPTDRRIDFLLDNGMLLSLLDSSEHFESMQIYSPEAGAPIVVI